MDKNVKKWGIAGAIITFVIGLILYYTMGRGNTHADGIDYSNYTIWGMFFAGIFGLFVVLFIVLYGNIPEKGTHKGKGKVFYVVSLVLFMIGLGWATVGIVSGIRAWNENAQTADITISNADSGDFTLNTANVEAYKNKDGTVYKWTRFISFDDRYKLAFEINCTNFTVGNDSVQLYNSTTATLQGYNILKEATTARYSPSGQPGDFTTTTNGIVVVFEDLPRRADSPDRAITSFNLSLWDEDGVILASWIVYTDPRLGEWTI